MSSPALTQLNTLADPTRVRLLLLLEENELAVGEMCAITQLPQSTVSRHLRVLGSEGWVASRADGTSRHYRLASSVGDWERRLWAVVREDIAVSQAADQDRTRAAAILLDRQRRSRAYFSGVAEEWDKVRTELFGASLDRSIALSLLDERAVIGDLGCAAGQLSAALAPYVRQVIAVDTLPEMLAAARERLEPFANVEVRQGELERLPLTDATLDVAILSLVLHYVADPAPALAEAYRVLRPGGRIVVLEMLPHDRQDLQQAMGHFWPGFSTEQMRTWLGAAGYLALHIYALPVDAAARGPQLFLCRARK